nr:uncharacterized protein LOC117219328 [Megalopta genalis]
MSKKVAGEEGASQETSDSNAELYETKSSKKVVRLITAVAYMISVSFVAIGLSAYYLFLWVPPDPRLLRRPEFLVGDDEIPFERAEKFRGRTVDDDSNETSRLIKRQQILDQSLLMLKLYIMDQQRNRTKYNTTGSNLTEKIVESETGSPTIFGDQANGLVAQDQGKDRIPASSPIEMGTVDEMTSEDVIEETQAERTTVRSVSDGDQQTEELKAAVRTSTISSLRTNSSTTPTGILFIEEQDNVLKHSNVDSVGFLDNSNNGYQRKSLTNTSSEND